MRKIIPRIHPRRSITSVIPKIITTVILSILVTDLIFSQQKNRILRGREEKVLEYQLVEEKDLGQNLREVIYSKRTKNSPMKPQYISKYFLTQDGMKITGDLLRADNFQKLTTTGIENNFVFSDYGNFYSEKKVVERKLDGSLKMRIKFYQAPDVLLWEKEYERGYDLPDVSFIVSDFDGSVIEINNIHYIINFYNSRGDSINTVSVFSNPKFMFEKGITGRFSENGQYFVVIADDPGPPPDYPSSILLFSNKGELQWSFESPKRIISGTVWASWDASYIVSYHFDPTGKESDRVTYLHDRDGNVIEKYDGMHLSNLVFSDTQEYVVLNNGNEVNLIMCRTGEIVVHYPHWGRGPHILHVDISEELGVIAILEGRVGGQKATNSLARFTNGKITVLNFNGVELWKHQLPIIEGIETKSKLSLSEDGKTIGLKLSSTYSEYKLLE